MERVRTVAPRARGADPSHHPALGWIVLVSAVIFCTFVIYHAFPEDLPRSTFSIDTVPDREPAQTVEAQNLR